MVSVPHCKLVIFHHHVGEDVGWNFFSFRGVASLQTWWNYTRVLAMEFSTPNFRASGDHDPLGGGNSKILFHVQPKKSGKMKPFWPIFFQGVGSTIQPPTSDPRSELKIFFSIESGLKESWDLKLQVLWRSKTPLLYTSIVLFLAGSSDS